MKAKAEFGVFLPEHSNGKEIARLTVDVEGSEKYNKVLDVEKVKEINAIVINAAKVMLGDNMDFEFEGTIGSKLLYLAKDYDAIEVSVLGSLINQENRSADYVYAYKLIVYNDGRYEVVYQYPIEEQPNTELNAPDPDFVANFINDLPDLARFEVETLLAEMIETVNNQKLYWERVFKTLESLTKGLNLLNELITKVNEALERSINETKQIVAEYKAINSKLQQNKSLLGKLVAFIKKPVQFAARLLKREKEPDYDQLRKRKTELEKELREQLSELNLLEKYKKQLEELKTKYETEYRRRKELLDTLDYYNRNRDNDTGPKL